MSTTLGANRVNLKTALAAGTVLETKYKTDGGTTTNFERRYLEITPVRVSG